MPRLAHPTSATAADAPPPAAPLITGRGYAWPEYIRRHLKPDQELGIRELMKALLVEDGLPALQRLMRDPTLPAALRLRSVEFLTERVLPPLSATTLDAETDVDSLPSATIVVEPAPDAEV